MARVTIDNRVLDLDPEERLNGIEAAARLGIEIPHYCWHPGLSVVGSCRMCLVEYGMRDPRSGAVTMLPKLVPACQTPATDGAVFVTNSPKVAAARAMVEEGLLLRHPVDCPICDKAGECFLQDYHFRYGQEARRADIAPFMSRRRDLGPDITLFVDRCILCSRCVRFVREVSGTGELLVTGRGAREEIDVLDGFPLNNNLSGNVVDLCPVGALGDKHFLYRQRVWFMRSHPGICTGCAAGCAIWIEENQDRVHRIRPRENLEVNRWWICNEGRWGYPHVHDPRRLARPLRREGNTTTPLDWRTLVGELRGRFGQAGPLAAAVSPFLSVEEAYLLCTWVRSIDPEALLVLGPVPVVGEDEVFPGGFTIAAEKCPNRRGAQRVLAHFAGRVHPFARLVEQAAAGAIGGVWGSGGYRKPWIDTEVAARRARAGLVVVQDLFDSPLSQQATYVLPGAAFPERDGSYVNRDGRLQSAARAIRPPAGIRTEGSLLWELAGRPGLYQAGVVLEEVVREVGMGEGGNGR